MQNLWLLMGDEQFYAPLRPAADDPGRLSPAEVPDPWSARDSGVWRYWQRPGLPLADQGWKVHVSATPERLQAVLDTVARACFDLGVSFKHLATRDAYMLVHQKHSPRVQAGKFCAAYAGQEDAARVLMERLRGDLDGEPGVYVLTDRRYRDSKVVHYRYGAFVSREKLQLDGTRLPMMTGPDGNLVPDERRPSFVLPAGLGDPFLPPPDPEAAAASKGPVVLDGRFEVQEVIRHSNGGGTYQALDRQTGARVFVKEARGHNGYGDDWADARERLLHEYRTLVRVHAADPGLCPEPVAHFTQWEHDFLVTEFVEGMSLLSWAAGHLTLPMTDIGAERRAVYHEQVGDLLARLRDALDRLHALGLRFGDLSHGNVLVASDDDGAGALRLIDFETATELTEPPSRMGTLGYAPPEHLKAAGVDGDEYGYSALAMLLLFPLARPLQADPAGRLELHRRDLDGDLPVPDALWEQAARFYAQPVPGPAAQGSRPAAPVAAAGHDHPAEPVRTKSASTEPASTEPASTEPAPTEPVRTAPVSAEPAPAAGPYLTRGGAYRLPTVAELEREPHLCLTRLGDGIAAGLTAMARPEHPDWLYPPGTPGFSVNTHCRAHGSAGVLLALHRWGAAIPEDHLARFRHDVLAAEPSLPPGLDAGTAGIAWTLAELGLLDEADGFIRSAQAHPLLPESVLLWDGSAGVGLARLRLAHATGDLAHVEAAVRLADGILADDLAAPRAQAGTAGLEQGLSGVALFLHALAGSTGESRYTDAAVRLMHEELDRGEDRGEDGLRFTDRGGRRVITYLSIGSAGVAAVLSPLAAETGDARMAAALPRVLAPCRSTSSVEPGLYTGLASWAYALAEQADHMGGPQERETALRVATSLVKYAVRFPGGLRVLGAFEPRFHCDLASGGAGVLLALARVLNGPRAGLLTVDPADRAAAGPPTAPATPAAALAPPGPMATAHPTPPARGVPVTA